MSKIIKNENKEYVTNRKNTVEVYFQGEKVPNTVTTMVIILALVFLMLISLFSVAAILENSKKAKLSSSNTISSEKTKDMDILSIDNLSSIYDQYYDYQGEVLSSNELKDYSLLTDKFTFRNFGSYNSDEGMCAGFSMYEKLNYLDQLKTLQNDIEGNEIEVRFNEKQDLSEIKLTQQEIANIYPGNILQSESIKNIKGEVRYNMSTEFYDNVLEDFTDKVSNKELANVLNVINYLQKSIFIHTESYPRSVISPNRYSNRKDYDNIKSNNDLVKEFDIEMITKKIDNNEPVVLGVRNPKKGHALLGYKYEYINNNTVKFYISDSNIVFNANKPADKAEQESIERYNYDVKNNVYMLFSKDENDSQWQFIYNPKLNNNYIYKGEWNSYIPGTYFWIYE